MPPMLHLSSVTSQPAKVHSMQGLRSTTLCGMSGSHSWGRLLVLGALVATGCAPVNLRPTPTSTASAPPTSAASPIPSAAPGTSAVVVFVKDGDLLVWDEASAQSQTLFDAGDAISVSVSGDGQVVAFLRRSIIGDLDSEWRQQSALWVVNWNGENPRELVSAEELRRLLNASETESTNIPQLEWVPGTHRLLYSGWTYIVQAEGESHAVPEGLHRVDADSSENTVLQPAGDNLRFVPSPDGAWIALISSTGLSFVDSDGSGLRPDVLTYPSVGETGPLFPIGVWTQDSRAFLITGSLERHPSTNHNFTIWRVPVDGSPAQALAAVTDSIVDSVTFSPDGRYVAYFRHAGPAGQATDFGWYIAPLAPEAGALAVSRLASLFWKNLHWSPAGTPYAFAGKTLFQLCQGAVQDTETCGEGFELGGDLASLHWMDGTRFLYTTREPYDLYFGRLDGASVRIAEEVEDFAAVPMTCRNDAKLVSDGGVTSPQQIAPDTVLLTYWRIRNIGTCVWDPSYRLAFLGGERLSGPRALYLKDTVSPGGEVTLTVRIIAPAVGGSYQGRWQLFAPDGTPFGGIATVNIVVPFDESTALAPDQVVAKIAVGQGPRRVALGEGAAWVTNEAAGTVSRIDLDTNRVVATVPVGNSPRPVAVGYGAVWVGNLGDGTVSRIDPSTNSVTATIPLDPSRSQFGPQLSGLAVGAGAVWVAGGITGADHGGITRIDPATNQVVATIEVERWPAQVVALDDAVWVTHSVTPFLTRIDPATNAISATLNLECPTMGLAADATGVWAACVDVPVLLRIDPLTNQVAARIAIGPRSEDVAVGPNGVWVTSGPGNTLTRIDPEANMAARVYAVGQGPQGVAIDQVELWVVMSDENAIWRVRP